MRKAPGARPPAWIVAVMILCAAVELAQWVAPAFGYPYARAAVAFLGGFWSPVFWLGQGQVRGQAFYMFLSYGLIHGGVIHLAMNMLSLAVVGRALAQFFRTPVAVLVYLICQIAAALCFALLSPESGPMVGASGAIFGLAGALMTQATKWRRRRAMSLAPVFKAVGFIAVINIALTFAVPGIAWEAHLGGLVAGLLLGLVLPCRRP